MTRGAASVGVALLFAAAAGGVAGCRGSRSEPTAVHIDGADPHRGETIMETYGCGACHTIPGVRGAKGVVGPPLNAWAERGYIGGELPNTPRNLVTWVMDPPSIEPNTAMPNLGVDEVEAKDIAAYLYTLD
ncbi:MAG TPA: c-type cytochrome [Gammaproteobacteria bacterium]|nr:c-type cytochrome [Gammaproteobacteria bacterium]